MRYRKELRDYYKQWLDRYRQASDLAPVIKDALSQVEWELDALSDIPNEAADVPTAALDEQAEEAYARIQAILPPMPEFPCVLTFQVNSISTSSTTGVTSFVSNVGNLGFPAAASYASKHLESYERLQRSQQRPAAVRSAIEELFTGDTLTRFDVAHSGVRKTELGVSSASAAAMEIRTFLDGVQGQLFSAARKHPQQSMNWEIMARALFDRPCDATMLNQLLAQGPLRSELIDELSGIGKRRTAHDQNDLKNVWMRSLDHVFIVLNLLRIRRARNP